MAIAGLRIPAHLSGFAVARSRYAIANCTCCAFVDLHFHSLHHLFCSVVPGRPEVSIRQEEDAAVALSWKLKCKIGIIQEYHMSYFIVDDSSNAETLTTKATTVRIERLAPGKTFEFQVRRTR